MLILSMVIALTEITLIMLFTLTFLHVRIYIFFYYNGLTSKSVSGHVALNSLPREKQI